MEKAYFPMFVDISEKKIIVVGGGQIAARRVETLTHFAGDITVIAPEVNGTIRMLEAAGKIHCEHREYAIGDVRDADMVLAATDRKDLNHAIAMECMEIERESHRNILLSVADDRQLCDFYFPAVIQKDNIVIGINSGGSDPGKVKRLRKRLEEDL